MSTVNLKRGEKNIHAATATRRSPQRKKRKRRSVSISESHCKQQVGTKDPKQDQTQDPKQETEAQTRDKCSVGIQYPQAERTDTPLQNVYVNNAAVHIGKEDELDTLRLVHKWSTGTYYSEQTRYQTLKTRHIPTSLPEEGAPWDSVQAEALSSLWRNDADKETIALGNRTSENLNIPVPNVDVLDTENSPPIAPIQFALTPKSDGISFIGVFDRNKAHPLVILEPRAGNSRVIYPILDTALVSQFLQLHDITRLAFTGEVVCVGDGPGDPPRPRYDNGYLHPPILYLLIHDVLGVDDIHLYGLPRVVRIGICQSLGERLDHARATASPKVREHQMAIIQVKPFALTRAKAHEMLSLSVVTLDGRTLDDALLDRITAARPPTRFWFRSIGLLFAIPVDGFVLVNLFSGGLSGRSRIVRNIPNRACVSAESALDPRAPVTKFRFYSGADLAFVPTTPSHLATSKAKALELVHHHMGEDRMTDSLVVQAHAPRRRQATVIPAVVQVVELTGNKLCDQIRAEWDECVAGRSEHPPVVECVIDRRTRKWIPTRLRTDKTHPNTHRVVIFAQNAGVAYEACGGLTSILLRAFPLL